jgi:hypothetical protein
LRQIDEDARLLLKLGFQGSDARFQFGDAGIVVAASLTEGSIHTFKVAAPVVIGSIAFAVVGLA